MAVVTGAIIITTSYSRQDLPLKDKFSNFEVRNKDYLNALNNPPDNLAFFTHLLARDRILATYTEEPDEVLNVIVELTAPPLQMSSSKNLKKFSNSHQIDIEHDRFQSDLDLIGSQIASMSMGKRENIQIDIKLEFTEIFNGFSLTTTRRAIQEIQKLTYVQKIYPNTQIQALPGQDLLLHGVNRPGIKSGVKGDSISIAIIDTGIDYNHPDLGGGFGTGHKVVGGYDFINKDADPVDDNGHGTHVAGILSANGDTITGIAPHAKLLAYKVLDANGHGYMDNLIAGIDRALNPDRNRLTDDMVDIINVCIAGTGNANDAAARAIDNAVAAGVVCVVGAGNEEKYFSITTPGVARAAITVGATDRNDKIARLSSCGPNPKTFEIKPDVVAPGVAIKSTWLNGSYRVTSGTSMATPHVSGVAALLKQLHPNWTPLEIKAAIMEGAVDLGLSPFVQGSGRLDASNSETMQTLVLPPSLSFGIDDFGRNQTWIKKDTIWIKNLSDNARSYHIAVKGSLPVGVSLVTNPGFLEVPARTASALEVILSVNNAVTRLLADEPYAYYDRLVFTTTTETIEIPFAFLRSSFLQLEFDQVPKLGILVHNGKNKSRTDNSQEQQVILFLPPDTYDVLVNYNPFNHIIKEKIRLDDVVKLVLPITGVKNEFRLTPVDKEESNLITLKNNLFHINHTQSGFGVMFNIKYGIDLLTNDLKFSNFSDDYSLEYIVDYHSSVGHIYQINDAIQGMEADLVVKNDPRDFNHFTLEFKPELWGSNLYLYKSLGWGLSNFNNLPVFTEFIASSGQVLSPPYVQEVFYAPQVNTDSPFLSFYASYDYKGIQPNPMIDTVQIVTPYILAADTSQLIGKIHGEGFPEVFSTSSHRLNFGISPPHWFGKFKNDLTSITIGPAIGSKLCLFLDALQGLVPYQKISWELYRDEVRLQTGSLVNVASPQSETGFIQLQATPGHYQIKFNYNDFYVGNTRATARVTARFTTGSLYPDMNPPYMTHLQVFSNGRIQESLEPEGDNQILLSVADDQFLWNVELEYRTIIDKRWQKLDLVEKDSYYLAILPGTINRGLVNLRLVCTDFAENSLTYELYPAFNIRNDPPRPFSLISPVSGDTIKTITPELKWHQAEDPNDDRIGYELYISSDSTFTDSKRKIEITGLSTTHHVLQDSLEDNQFYYWQVLASDHVGGRTWSSGQYHFWLNYINDAPFITGLPDTSFFEDAGLELDLNKYLDDVDNDAFEINIVANILSVPAFAAGFITNTVKQLSNTTDRVQHATTFIFESDQHQDSITVAIDENTHIATFTSSKNWYGPSVPFVFTACDPEGMVGSDTMTVAVLPVNDPPVLLLLPEIHFAEDHFFKLNVKDWYPYVEDIDDPDVTLSWRLGKSDNINIFTDSSGSYFNPLLNWYGRENVSIYVTDPAGLSDTTNLVIDISPVNDAPQIDNIPDTSFTTGSTLKLDLTEWVFDVDDSDSSLVWSISGNDSIRILLDDRNQLVTIQASDFCGTEQIIFQVSDGHGGFDLDTVKISATAPENYLLAQNYPNPFNLETKIEFFLPKTGTIKLAIYDLLGNVVHVLVDEKRKPGRHVVRWHGTDRNGKNVASGIYFCRMVAFGEKIKYVDTKKMIVLR